MTMTGHGCSVNCVNMKSRAMVKYLFHPLVLLISWFLVKFNGFLTSVRTFWPCLRSHQISYVKYGDFVQSNLQFSWTPFCGLRLGWPPGDPRFLFGFGSPNKVKFWFNKSESLGPAYHFWGEKIRVHGSRNYFEITWVVLGPESHIFVIQCRRSLSTS